METSTNKILIMNYSDNNEKNRNAIDIVELQNFASNCIRIFLIILIIFMPFLFGLLSIPYRRVIIIDEVKAAIIIVFENFCNSCSCCRENEKIYYLSQIKKVKIYLSSIPDPKIGFHKKYFINCDVFSLDNALESLFSNIDYSKEKIDELISFFQGHLNPDITTLEVDMGDINENNTSYPLLNGNNQTPNLPSIDESV